jgi:hypothetical protein
MSFYRTVRLAGFGLLVAAVPLWSQTGGAEGRVVSGAGNALSQADLIFLRPDRSVAARAATDASGAWRVSLAPGRYELLVRRLGFRPASETIEVPQGVFVLRNVVLQPVALSLDSLIVSAPAVRISTRDTELRSRMTVREVALLPTAFDARDLVGFTPGARPDQIWGGASDQANSYVLDGAIMNHPGLGGAFFLPSVSWIESVDVRGLGAGADQGNFQGGMVDIATRSGGNTVEGAFRTALESHRLNGSNFIPREIGRELGSRYEFDTQLRGPLDRDHLFYAIFGHLIREETRVLDHLGPMVGGLAPQPPTRMEGRWLLKLDWRPNANNELRFNVAGRIIDGERWNQTGYEAPEATSRHGQHTVTFGANWQRTWSARSALELRVGGYLSEEKYDPYGGPDVPSLQTLERIDPSVYLNSVFQSRSAPSSVDVGAKWTIRRQVGGMEHELILGAEYVWGSWDFDQSRTGGMTWRPVRPRLDPLIPATWSSTKSINTGWGGEVHIASDVGNGAVFLQDHVQVTPWLRVNPGLRFGMSRGALTPAGGGARFTAVKDEAFDPRVGVVFDLDRAGGLVLKGHWGLYHQTMFASLFDRVLGAGAYSNEEVWTYSGPSISDPAQTFSVAERDALAASGQFTLQELIRLDQEGQVEGYRQPYVDQRVLSLEKTLGTRWKATAAYIWRRNKNMVALVDKNLASNYTVYENVEVLNRIFRPIIWDGKPLVLERVAISNEDIIRNWQLASSGVNPDPDRLAPGFSAAELAALRYEPDLVLTAQPEAQRQFKQFQLQVEARYPTWWIGAGATWTSLRGNLNTVTGPDDFTNGGPGPWVRLNEQFNSFGDLSNQSLFELKVQVGGILPAGFRGGVFATYFTGDHRTPTITMSNLFVELRVPREGATDPAAVDSLRWWFLNGLSGHRIFVQPRGKFRLPHQGLVNTHLERSFAQAASELVLTLDVFNVLGARTVTDLETALNTAINPLGSDFGRVRGRVAPRTVRLGAAVRF